MLIDSHCHLEFDEYAGETEAVIARARAAGVGLMLTISTSIAGFPKVRALAEQHADIYCSVGVHPHDAEAHASLALETLVAAAHHARIIGVGETGLDYYYEKSPREIQKVIFRRHIAAARETG